MKIILFILLFLVSYIQKGRDIVYKILLPIFYLESCVSAQPNKFNVNHGFSTIKIDEKLKDSIQILHFKNSEGIIFPQEYAKKKMEINKDILLQIQK